MTMKARFDAEAALAHPPERIAGPPGTVDGPLLVSRYNRGAGDASTGQLQRVAASHRAKGRGHVRLRLLYVNSINDPNLHAPDREKLQSASMDLAMRDLVSRRPPSILAISVPSGTA